MRLTRRRWSNVVLAAMLLGVVAGGTLGTARGAFSDTTTNAVNTYEAGDWTKWTEVDGGREFSCAANEDGSAWCWGKGDKGQLGNGTTGDRTSPVQVLGAGGSGVLEGVVDITAGSEFSCAVLDDGSVWCWGRGDKGQLGNGATSDSSVPVQVQGVGGTGTLAGIVDAAAGEKHACAGASDGSVYCWGENNVGQLGDGSTTNRSTPVQTITGPGGFAPATVGAGLDHSCAVTDAGTVQCWGEGSSGQIGDGGTSARTSPQTVLDVGGSGSLPNVVEVDGGEFHTCARHGDGSLTCWGSNAYGQLAPSATGDGTAVWRDKDESQPEQAVLRGSSFAAPRFSASIGEMRTMQSAVADDDSEAIVVGTTPAPSVVGEMWDGSSWSALPFSPATSVADGFWWSVGVAYESMSGDLMLVHDNGTNGTEGLSYRIWDGASWTAESTITTPVSGEPKHMRLARHPASDEMVLVVSNENSTDYAFVWDGSAWGNAITLATAASDDLADVFVAYEQSSGVAMVVYGRDTSSVYHRTWDGSAWSSEGSTSVPSGAAGRARRTVLASDPGTDRIALGVVTDNHDSWAKVWSGSAWGDAQVLSTTTGTSTGLAVAVAFEAVSGDLVAAYADDDNRVRYRTWTSAGGWTAEADVSDFGAKARSVVLFPDDDTDEMMVGAVDVNSGLNMSRWDGSTWWTDEILLEKDTAESENQPFIFLWDVVGLAPQPAWSAIPLPVVGHTAAAWSDATDLGLADEFSCATTTSGKAYCWGRNEHGELGDGTMTQRTVPTRVVGSGGSATLDDVSVVGGGWNTHTCASVADREELWCWGRNNKGQLGDGTTTDSSSPVFSRGST